MGYDVLGSIEQSWHARRQVRAHHWNGCSSARSFGAADRDVPLASFPENCNARPIPRSHRAVARSVSVTTFALAGESDDLDFYEVLGISRQATAAEVKTAFRRLAKELHPDCTSGNKVAHRRFLAVQCAYTVLRNGDRRADYDLYLRTRDTGEDIQPDGVTAGFRPQPQRRRYWRRAVKSAAATIAFVVVFTTGTLLWQRDTNMQHSDLTAGLTAANATMAPAISVEQLADALYGSDAVLFYGSTARGHRDTITPPVDPDARPSVDMASLGTAGSREADDPVGRQPHSIDLTALLEGVRLVESGNRELARGNIIVARLNFARAADHGLAVAAARLADTFEARTLARVAVRGVKPNQLEARKWRVRALELSTEISLWSIEP